MEKLMMLWIISASACAAPSADDSIPRITYNFVYDGKTWSQAKIYCEEQFTGLMSVESMEHVNKLNALADPDALMNRTNSREAWIGMQNDWDQWTWSFQDSSFYQKHQMEYTNWLVGEPNFALGKVQCTEMYESGVWNDAPCEWSRRFACMTVNGLEVTFHHSGSDLPWTEARSYCRQHYTDLASVRHLEDNQRIQDLKVFGLNVWLGLYRSGWRYLNGTLPKFSYWRDGQPNPDQQDCAVANFGNQGRWEDSNCNNLRASICYHVVPISEKVVRLRLQRSPAVDLNDPEALEQLLMLFKLKLRERGVSGGLTLSWRAKADGKIFHPERKLS